MTDHAWHNFIPGQRIPDEEMCMVRLRDGTRELGECRDIDWQREDIVAWRTLTPSEKAK